MTQKTGSSDWDPGAYARFDQLRHRPGLDLLNSIGPFADGDIVDLGCGNGALAEALQRRAGGRALIGVDTSPAMLKEARARQLYDRFDVADVAQWVPPSPVAVIFANASLQWLDDHAALLPRLSTLLAPGGTLAVQMPNQNKAPSHRVWLSLAQEMFPDAIASMKTPGVLAPMRYEEMLSGLGQFRMWETEYYQKLTAEPGSHPVRRFTESTYARPILDALARAEAEALIARYEEAMLAAYPQRADGSVLFPFRRIFFTLTI